MGYKNLQHIGLIKDHISARAKALRPRTGQSQA